MYANTNITVQYVKKAVVVRVLVCSIAKRKTQYGNQDDDSHPNITFDHSRNSAMDKGIKDIEVDRNKINISPPT